MSARGLCVHDDCTRARVRRGGLCHFHFRRESRGLPLDTPPMVRTVPGPCLAPACYTPARAMGRCIAHYERWRRGDPEWDRPVRRLRRSEPTVNIGHLRIPRWMVDALDRSARAARITRARAIEAALERSLR